MPKLSEQAAKAKAAHLALCRQNFGVFISYVMRDESTGKKLKLAWLHKKWAQLAQTTNRLNIISATELGKSQILSVAYPLWVLGNDPRIRIAIISASNEMASKILKLIASYIEGSDELHEVFPGLRPSKGNWKSDSIVVERPIGTRDPSVGSYGVDTKRLHGSRLDLVILDDIDSPKTTATAEGRAKLANWVTSMVLSRVRGGQVISVSNAWNPGDFSHQLAKQKSYTTVRCPVLVSQEVLDQWPDSPYKLGESIWPERWTPELIQSRRSDASTTPGEFERSMLCKPRTEDLSWFKEASFDAARARGKGYRILHSLEELMILQGIDPLDLEEERKISDLAAICQYYPSKKDPDSMPNYVVVHGVDLASGRNKDQTAIVTVARLNDGSRMVLNVQRGNFQGSELIRRMKETFQVYGGVFIVETNSIQLTLAQILSEISTLPIVPFETRLCDKVLGFSRISAEFDRWLWIFPSGDGERCEDTLELLLAGLMDYSPRSHTEDSAMALLFASNFINKLEYDWGVTTKLKVISA